MNSSEEGPAREPKEPFFSRPFCLVLAVSIFVGLVMPAFYALENWRGNRAWNNYRRAQEARGILLEPPVVSLRAVRLSRHLEASYEEEIHKAGAAFDSAGMLLYEARSYSLEPPRVDLVAWKQALEINRQGNSNQNQTIGRIRSGDLKIEIGNTHAGARAEAAVAVLDAFSSQNTVLEKIRTTCRRPEPVFPLGYDGPAKWGPVPRVFEAIHLCQQLRVRTAAELASGDCAEALRDLDLILCISDSLRQETLLIGGIGGMACRRCALQTAWEALAERRFTEPELRQLEQLLGADDLLGDIPRFLWSERAQLLQILSELQETRDLGKMAGKPAGGSLGLQLRQKTFDMAFCGIPAGWVQLDILNYCRAIDSLLDAGFTDSHKRVQSLPLKLAYEKLQAQQCRERSLKALFNHTVFSSFLIPRVNDWAMSCTIAQVMTDQTRLACALERYYLRHERYPDNLEQLVPECLAGLPSDPFTGEPYRYRRDENRRYKVWSVGWNDKDDGGVPSGQSYDASADWVWWYPES